MDIARSAGGCLFLGMLGVIGLTAVIGKAVGGDPLWFVRGVNEWAYSKIRPSGGRCGALRKDYCVVDGKTLILPHTRIVLANIDVPRIEDAACPAERAMGEQAADRLAGLMGRMRGAMGIALVRDDPRDPDAETLRTIRMWPEKGEPFDVGETLIAEGLAQPWTGTPRDWCAGA